MHCQSCGLPIPPTTQVCPRCKQPIAPNLQSAQNQRGNLPSTEQFPWQSSNKNSAALQSPLHWNNENHAPFKNTTPAPFNPSQLPQANSDPLLRYPYPGANNLPSNQSQGEYQNIPHRTPDFTYPQMAGNQQPISQQGPGQTQVQNYAQINTALQSGPIQPQAFTQGSFPPGPLQSGPIQPQNFSQGSFPPGPLQSSPIQPQNFSQGSFPPGGPLQSGPIQPQAFAQGSFPSGLVQSSPIQSQAFNGRQIPYTGPGTTFQSTPEQIQQHSPVGVVRSAGIIHTKQTTSMRKILLGIGAGFIIALLAAVGYLALVQKPATSQVSTPMQQIVQTHPKKLPPLPPITISDPQALYTQATSREAISTDPLHMQSDNNWEAVNSPGNCTFDGNTLHAVNSSTDLRATMCIASATKYKNIAFQAQLTTIKGDTSGLIMRADSKGQQLYLFGITTTGMYTLAVANGQNGSQQHILAGGTSAAIKQGQNQGNQLTIIARNTTLYLYINQKFITKVDDTTAMIGSIGLFEGNSQGDISEARFTDVKVWSV